MKRSIPPFVLALVALGSVGDLALAAVLKVPGHHTTIQAAVTAAAPGDTVLISAGDYTEVVDVAQKSFLSIRGKGKVRVDAMRLAPDCSDLSIRGITFVSTLDPALYGFEADDDALVQLLVGAPRVVVRKCRFEMGLGILVLNPAVANALSGESYDESLGLIADHVTIAQCKGTGAFAIGCENLVVEKNDFRMGIIAAQASPGAVVDGNRVGTLVVVSDDVTISDNKVSADGNYVMVIGDNNLFVGNRVDGISMGLAGVGVHAFSNSVRDGSMYMTGDGFHVRGNRVKNGPNVGMHFTDGGGHLIEKNRVRGSNVGLALSDTSGSLVRANRLKKNDVDLSDDSPVGSNTFEKNKYKVAYFED